MLPEGDGYRRAESNWIQTTEALTVHGASTTTPSMVVSPMTATVPSTATVPVTAMVPFTSRLRVKLTVGLARSTVNLLAIVTDLEARGVGLVIFRLGGQQLDTRNPTSKLLLTMLGAVATFEREIMLERQREGIAAAAAAGKYKGRAPTARAKAGRRTSPDLIEGTKRLPVSPA